MILLGSVSGYIVLAVILYFALRAKCKKSAIFKAPKRKRIFYLLSFTWGLPTVIAGAAVALVLRLKGYKPKKYGWVWCFEIPNINWGLSLGLFIITPPGYESVHMHEHGHCIQNARFGFFMPLIVSLPSVMRFWYRAFRKKRGKACTADYDAIWFEQSATKSGEALIRGLSGADGSKAL